MFVFTKLTGAEVMCTVNSHRIDLLLGSIHLSSRLLYANSTDVLQSSTSFDFIVGDFYADNQTSGPRLSPSLKSCMSLSHKRQV